MTTPNPPPIDIVSVAVALAALLFGQQMAQLIGPYAVIILGSTVGAGLSASRRETGASTVRHMCTWIGVALIATVPLAYALATYLDHETNWWLGPVAALIAGIGQDWVGIGMWAIDQARRLAEGWASRKGGDRP